ncbi:MAG: hypothetical protein IJB86_03610 [Clostridia bacterium]|nr:hypothetical protein [Clostridia bacterium]
MFKSISAFFVSIIIFFISCFTPAPPVPKTTEELEKLVNICKDFELSDKLYVVDSAVFRTEEERHFTVGLQGVVAKTDPCIFIITNGICHDYLDEIKNSGIELVYTDESGNKWTPASLLHKFKSYIKDSGYVLYRASEKAEGLNAATNLAAIYGWLPVPKSLEQLAIDEGLVLKEDFSDTDYNILFQWSFFEKYKDKFNYNAVLSLRYSASALRDLAIQQGFYTFYIDDDEDTNLLRGRVMQYAGDNVPVLGWVKYEVAFVRQASKNGNMAIPSDHSHNNSYLASFKADTVKQKHTVNEHTDTSKHYCAIVFSDGDNMQWIQNGYSEFYQKQALKEQFPVTWSFPPLLQEFSSVTVKKIYSDSTQNDYFMAGVSGAGYIHPTEYPYKALSGFTDLTASAMMKSDLHYVSILDSTPDNEIEDTLLTNRLRYYAVYDNIKGGVLSLDPTRYEGGKGKIYFVNDKPFISYRLSLWHPDGEGADVTNEWLSQQAQTVNSYPADISSINGYSVINVHPWTVSVDDLAYFVSCLDDDVVLVTLDDLMSMVSKNIPHETATPDN